MNLGTLFVEIVAKGVVGVSSQVEALAGRIAAAGGVVGVFSTAFTKAIRTAGLALASLSAGMLGFVTAALAGTVEGARLQWHMDRLARTIGALFLPVIEFAISSLSKLTDMLQSVSTEAARQVLVVTSLAGGFALLATGVAPITGAILMLVGAFTAMSASGDTAFAAVANAAKIAYDWVVALLKPWQPLLNILGEFTNYGDQLSGIWGAFFGTLVRISEFLAGVLLPVFRVVFNLVVAEVSALAGAFSLVVNFLLSALNGVAAMANWIGAIVGKVAQLLGLVKSSRDLANMIPDMKQPQAERQKELTPKTGGFESLTGTYNRIAQSVLNRFDPAQAHKEAQDVRKKTLEEIQDMNKNVKGLAIGAAA